LLYFREVQRLCCDHYLPFRLHKFSPQPATTGGIPTHSQKSRNGVMRICRKFHQYPDIATAVPSPAPSTARDVGKPSPGHLLFGELGSIRRIDSASPHRIPAAIGD
jgi:hypothetical protein